MFRFRAQSLSNAAAGMVPAAALALILILSVLAGAVSAEDGDGDLVHRIRTAAGPAFAAEQSQLARLRTSTDPAAAVQLARLLKSGLRVSPTNPLRVSHEEEALALLRKTIVLPGAVGAEAAAVLGAILLERAGSADREEALAMLRRAARAGDGSSAVRLADAILANRFGDPTAEEEAGALYASALAKREPGAAQGFARLAADPDLAATYRRQGMMLLKLRSEKSGSSAFQLAEAYRTGFGIEVDTDAARRHYREALSLGYGPAVSIFASAGVATDEEVVAGLADALSAGSKEAALAIVRAYLNHSQLPVTGEDARFAISLLREIRNPDAGIIEARLHLTGRDPFSADDAAAEAVVDTIIAEGVANPVTLLNYGRQLRDLPNAPAGPRIAMKIFLAAASGGEPLGAVHAVELLVEQDVDVADETRLEAMRALQTFADAGDGRSLVLLADLYRDGDGVERSATTARTLYRKAIDLAEEPAAYERLASLVLETAYDVSDLREALDLYAAAADAGSAGATAAIGRIYMSGRGEIAPNMSEGERLLMQAAENGYTAALVQLADYLIETGNAADIAKAESLYRRALESGEAGGGVGLANLLLSRGDRDAALPLFRNAVAADDPSAMVGLARWLLSGTTDDAVQEARDLIRLARRTAADDTRTLLDVADTAFDFPDDETRALGLNILVRLGTRGDSEARRRLVRVHVNGDIGRKDKDEAIRWAYLALKDGTVEPAVLLGEAMLSGDSPELADPARGRSILEEVLVVAPESVKALTRLGAAYAAGIGGPADVEGAFALYLRAAEGGSINAEIRVANAYLNGVGVERNPARAHLWYLRAAEAGSRDAMVYLARMYASGAGASIDAEQSFVWFYRAAELGSVDAMQEIGKALIAGYGSVKDPEQGTRWLIAAAEQASVGAMYDLYSYHSLFDDEASFAEALVWLRKAAENGSATAMFRLAVLQRSDNRLIGERDQAIGWLRRAAAVGHKGSQRLLGRINQEIDATEPDADATSASDRAAIPAARKS